MTQNSCLLLIFLDIQKVRKQGLRFFSKSKIIQKFLLLRSKAKKNIQDVLGNRHRTNLIPCDILNYKSIKLKTVSQIHSKLTLNDMSCCQQKGQILQVR